MDSELRRTQALVERARSGERRAYEELFRVHRAWLERRVRDRCPRKLEASDLIQDALVDAVRGFDGFRPRGPGSFRAWLATLLENRLRMSLRHGDRARRSPARQEALGPPSAGPPASITSPSEAAAREERERSLRNALEGLAPRHREVLRLVKLEGRGVAEAARLLGTSENAVKKRLARALLALRGELGDERGE
jgi:RNA polymerase sigma-70 factor (ECF subfamily)